MDQDLADRLMKIKSQIEALYAAEENYLTLDSAKDHKLAVLKMSHPDAEASNAARETWAFATDEWRDFKELLAEAEAFYHKEKHMLDLQNNTFQAQYLAAKTEYDMIKKGG